MLLLVVVGCIFCHDRDSSDFEGSTDTSSDDDDDDDDKDDEHSSSESSDDEDEDPAVAKQARNQPTVVSAEKQF